MHGKVELGVIVIYGTHKLIAATTSICFIIVCKSSTFFSIYLQNFIRGYNNFRI